MICNQFVAALSSLLDTSCVQADLGTFLSTYVDIPNCLVITVDANNDDPTTVISWLTLFLRRKKEFLKLKTANRTLIRADIFFCAMVTSKIVTRYLMTFAEMVMMSKHNPNQLNQRAEMGISPTTLTYTISAPQ